MNDSVAGPKVGFLSAASAQMMESAIQTVISRVPDELRHQESLHMKPIGELALSGCLEYGDLAGTGLCRMTISPHTFRREQASPAPLNASPLILVMQVQNSSYFEQSERRGILTPGDWCLIDTSNPFGWNSQLGCEQIVMRLQRPEEPSISDLISKGAALRCSSKSGTARVLHSMVTEVMGQLNSLASYSAKSLAASLAATTWNALQEQLEAPAPTLFRDTQCSRLKTWIEPRLNDHDLSVDSIALGCAISARSVHRAFSDDPAGSVSNYIWHRRVSLCVAALKSPAQSHRSITDIAFSLGFSSSSHFSRVFREHMGVSPRAYRLDMTRLH